MDGYLLYFNMYYYYNYYDHKWGSKMSIVILSPWKDISIECPCISHKSINIQIISTPQKAIYSIYSITF